MTPAGRGAGEAPARNFGPAPIRMGLALLALGYFSLLIADQARLPALRSIVPGPVLFFGQIADLFPSASSGIIEYRAEGWPCGGRRYVELDMGRLFPMLAGNKENRFYRLMHFYKQSHKVLGALDEYCARRYPPVAGPGGPDRIGGVRFLSLILPLPGGPGEVARYARRPLSEYPGLAPKVWYRTPRAIAAARCSDPGPAQAVPGEGGNPQGPAEGKSADP